MTHQKRNYELSLLRDVMRVKGIGVRDIYGYVSHEFGDPVFKITRIVLDNDRTIDVEGEHDMPYLINDEDVFQFPEDKT